MTADKGEYGTGPGERPEIIGVTPFGRPVPHLAVSVARAGGTGVLDLGADRASGLAALADVRRWWPGPFGVRVPPGCRVRPGELPPAVGTVLVGAAALRSDDWLDVAGFARGRRLLIEIADPAEAAAVVRVARGLTGEVGLIARSGELTAFVLLQRLLADVDVPVHAAGDIGPHTAAAAVAGGAAGVVLDEQFAFVREMDLGGPVPTRPGSPAAALAGRYKTAGGVVQAVREQIRLHIRAAVRTEPLVSRADPAVVQGPMAQLTDGSAFAGAVAQDGGLPFLSLGLLDGGRVRALLRETAERLGERPWGAGVLGIAPPELRAEQLAAVRDTGAPYAIIAGGGPAEAAPLEAAGISTYLHVPFPALLGRFLDAGVRKFVFEGGESGGHVGPYASFPLWDAQVERLMAVGEDAGELSVMFAGGVHDARSAAMVAALAGPLAERGADVRVLMGTAYLFTPEAVAVGAILPGYQSVALTCAGTALLETAPGHAIRCARTPYVETFAETRRELEQAGTPPQEVRRRLDKLNLGRLRVAGKGLRLNTPVEPARQYAEGLYAMGQVAALRRSTVGIAALHEEVTSGGTAFLAARAAEIGVREAGEGAASRADIAIIGMGCVFPGARDADGFWANIVGGVDSITRAAGAERAGVIPEIPLDAPGDGAPIELVSVEVASRALEDAGYADRPFDRSRASVFLAAEVEPDGEDALPGAIAARLDLGGMTCTVGASSLAALDVACKDLLTRSSDMVLCGGADLRPGPGGHRPGGTVPGEGVACVVLRRLADAERDGDRIYAIVTSVAGGRRLTMERAHERAGIRAPSIGLVEADRPEPAAPDGAAPGSVTSQIGHTGCAAGIAGLIKTAYALHTGVLPGPPHPSRPWVVRPGERLAGVSEYGSGDAHFHAVLSGYGGGPEPVSGLAAWPAELFLIRGDGRAAAHAEIGRLSRLLKGDPRLRDLARTAASSEGPVQVAFVAAGLDDLRAKLALAAQARPAPGVFAASGGPGKVAFLFPGEDGSPGMFTDLFVAFPRLQRLLRLAGGRYPEGTLPPPAAGLAVHRLLTAVGVHPDLAAGHGPGELAALCAAGVIDDTAMIEISAGRAGLRSGDLRSPAFPVWANTAAGPYETEPSDLAGQPGAPVRFAEQIEAMYAAGARTFVETGPGGVLTGLVGTVLGDRPHTAVSCAAPGENTLVTLLHALAALAAAGAGVDPLPLFGGRGAQPLSDVPARPRLLVSGRSVRSAAGGRPAAASGTPATGRPAEAAVLEYLRTSRELIAAQRDAVLRHLAAPAAARAGAHVRTAALSGSPASPAPGTERPRRRGTPGPRRARAGPARRCGRVPSRRPPPGWCGGCRGSWNSIRCRCRRSRGRRSPACGS
ncbi:beta-ketoacyl synthase N-terminal-like domain-containing protein [Actinomadura formosensis]|uniref:beta-ketoacyl synthase N-terminal-like domain-containing protein n=3 Tax=Actinomadura formosensis TaxID=60706 RepID=UPI003D94824C